MTKKGSSAGPVPASEFARNFGRYRTRVQRGPIAVSNRGAIAGYFVDPVEYEQFQRYRQGPHSFATVDLSDEQVEAIAASRMDVRHAHLDALLDAE